MKRKSPCVVCGVTEGAMIFASDPWCCDDHRKMALLTKRRVKLERHSVVTA